MSNETLQEKHPKFYESSHLWIGAIEVEVNCDTTGTYRQIKKGEIFQLSALTLHEFQSMSALQNLTPKFKPQEGDQFIKDLESAVSAAMDKRMEFLVNEGENFAFYSTPNTSIRVLVEAVTLRAYACVGSEQSALFFDTAAYVTTLLKLGYYL
jgi:hypothetical protein